MQTTETAHGNEKRPALDPRKLAFGTAFSENFFTAEYRDGAWQKGRLEPLHNFSLHPASLVLHYAQTIFEGLKAFRQPDGRVRVFPRETNGGRFDGSARGRGMPPIGEAMCVEAVKAAAAGKADQVLDYPGS